MQKLYFCSATSIDHTLVVRVFRLCMLQLVTDICCHVVKLKCSCSELLYGLQKVKALQCRKLCNGQHHAAEHLVSMVH